MNKQEIFSKVVAHLRLQGKKSMMNPDGSGGCAYRGQDNTKCAVGCLIPDEEYLPEMEKNNIHGLRVFMLLRPTLNKLCGIEENYALLTELQYTHDAMPVDTWETMFKNIAAKFNLEYAPPSIVNTL